MSSRTVIIGSRGSGLALTQTRAILRDLAAANPDRAFEIKIIKTTGDHLSETGAPAIPAGKGVFTVEIEQALLRGEIDLAVHSLKDLPVEPRPDLVIGAIPRRADPRDVLLTREPFHSLDELPPGATIATGSPRRVAQLLHHRADLRITGLRGNIDTRIRKLREQADWSGLLLARAGLLRLQPDVTGLTLTPLPLELLLPAPGQGALALQIRANDAEILRIVTTVHDTATAACVEAERAFLAGLGGGCQAPVAAIGEIHENSLTLRGIAWIGESKQPRTGQLCGEPGTAPELGRTLAEHLLHA